MTSANYRVSKQLEKSKFGHLLRPKTNAKSKSHRRISCRDLGGGDCNGWLKMKTNSSRLRNNWNKYWFVLKNRCLYYYKQEEDDSYIGRFQLSGFQISPADSEKSEKLFAFRVHHVDHGTFLMASDRQQDMAKWMNMLLIATLDESGVEEGGVSGGEEDADNECDGHDLMNMEQHENSTLSELPHESAIPQNILRRKPPSSPIRENSTPPPDYDLDSPLSASPSRDDFNDLVKSFRQSRIDIFGTNNYRGSFLSSLVSDSPDHHQSTTSSVADAAADNPTTSSANGCCPSEMSEAEKSGRLLIKRRMLKDKEAQLKAIEDLFNELPHDGSTALARFVHNHPDVVEKCKAPCATHVGTH